MACDPRGHLWPRPWGRLVFLAPHPLLKSGAPEGHPARSSGASAPVPSSPGSSGAGGGGCLQALDASLRVCVSCVHTCCMCV